MTHMKHKTRDTWHIYLALLHVFLDIIHLRHSCDKYYIKQYMQDVLRVCLAIFRLQYTCELIKKEKYKNERESKRARESARARAKERYRERKRKRETARDREREGEK